MAELPNLPVFGATLVYGVIDVTPATPLAGIDEFVAFPDEAVATYTRNAIDQADEYNRIGTGYIDPGKLQVRLVFNKAQIATLIGFGEDKHSWGITFPDGSTVSWGSGAIVNKHFLGQKGNDFFYEITALMERGEVFTPAA